MSFGKAGRTLLVLAVAGLGTAACDTAPTEPDSGSEDLTTATEAVDEVTASSGLRFAELHYDNDGTDTGEAIELQGPAGDDLTDWRIVLYNGSNGEIYDDRSLSGTLDASCEGGDEGVAAFDYPTNGIQNGSPDGMALVDPSGAVVEFLSYEGDFTAGEGPADGLTSTDIGVEEGPSTPVGHSLQRDSTGTWQGPQEATFGTCHGAGTGDDDGGDGDGDGDDGDGDGDGGETGPVFLSEIRSDQPSVDDDEYFELGGAADVSLDGVTYVVLGDGPAASGEVEAVVPLSGESLDSEGTFVAAEGSFGLGSADLTTDLNFENGDNVTHLLARGFTGSEGDDLDTDDDGALDATPWDSVADCLALVDALGNEPRSIYCDTRIGEDASFVPGHAKRLDDGWISAGFDAGSDDTPGTLEFDPSAAVAGQITDLELGEPGVVTRVTVSASFIPLPVGYNRTIFASAVDDFGDEVDVDLTYDSDDSSVVTSNQFGDLTAEGVGEATITVAAPNGVSAEVVVDVVADAPSSVAYQDHTEFGTPVDGDPSDDIVLRKAEYDVSYSAERGGPNWVAWNLDEGHIGDVDRCDCYTPDDELPPSAPRVVNFDYTFSGYSRGHMAQSFNRTVTLPDNAATYLTTNILPQAQDNNGGPWGEFEFFTNGRAFDGEEVYIVAGGEYGDAPPTLKSEGKVAVPDFTWKVAVFMDRDEGLADVTSLSDVEIIAIRTPNRVEPGVRGSVDGISDDWEDYRVEVDEIEAAVGYDLLRLLPDGLEVRLESGFDDFAGTFDRLVAEDRVGNGAEQALGAHLDNATRRLERGRTDKAVRRLRQFLHDLGVFERIGKVDGSAAAELRSEAEAVIALLEG